MFTVVYSKLLWVECDTEEKRKGKKFLPKNLEAPSVTSETKSSHAINLLQILTFCSFCFVLFVRLFLVLRMERMALHMISKKALPQSQSH